MASRREDLADFYNQALCSCSQPAEKQLFGKYQILLYLGTGEKIGRNMLAHLRRKANDVLCFQP